MGRGYKHLSRQHLILGTTIALLAACSQQFASSTPNLKSSAPDAATSPPATPTSVRKKLMVSQQANEATPTSQTALPPCSASDLQAVLDEMQGGAGSLYGTIKFTNADTACILQGRPQIKLVNSLGQPLPIKEKVIQPDEGRANVILQPRHSAYLTFRWVNWCLKQANNDIKFVVDLPESVGQVPVVVPDRPEYHNTPACNGAEEPSSLSVGRFKPTASLGEQN